jgi:hypothetical protein
VRYATSCAVIPHLAYSELQSTGTKKGVQNVRSCHRLLASTTSGPIALRLRAHDKDQSFTTDSTNSKNPNRSYHSTALVP